MTPLFRKLNLAKHREIVVLNSPASFESELSAIELDGVVVLRDTTLVRSIGFGIFFVTTLKAVAAASKLLTKADGDPVIWFACSDGGMRWHRLMASPPCRSKQSDEYPKGARSVILPVVVPVRGSVTGTACREDNPGWSDVDVSE